MQTDYQNVCTCKQKFCQERERRRERRGEKRGRERGVEREGERGREG